MQQALINNSHTFLSTKQVYFNVCQYGFKHSNLVLYLKQVGAQLRTMRQSRTGIVDTYGSLFMISKQTSRNPYETFLLQHF